MSMVSIGFDEVVYPESDGLPMAEGEEQGEVIRTLFPGYRHLYRDAEDVHVAGDMFWYPTGATPALFSLPT